MIKAYKGFDKNMQCRGIQFEEGKSYEEQEAILCEKGFHACTNPIDVFAHYAPGESVYHEVELDDVSPKREGDSKLCGRKIRIDAGISVRDMIRAGVRIDIDTAKTATSGNFSHAATSGDNSPAATSGNFSHAATSGMDSIAAAIGRNARAKAAIGNWIVLAEYGDFDGRAYTVLNVKCGKVDGTTLKPNVWYRPVGGAFAEVNDA